MVSDLHICPACKSSFVYPVTWAETPDDQWQLRLRCPNCEWGETGVYKHEQIEAFDHTLNLGTDRLIDNLELMTKANMEADIERFSAALEGDHLLPEDF